MREVCDRGGVAFHCLLLVAHYWTMYFVSHYNFKRATPNLPLQVLVDGVQGLVASKSGILLVLSVRTSRPCSAAYDEPYT